MRYALAISLLTACVAFGQTPTTPTISASNAATVLGPVTPGSFLSIRVNGISSDLPFLPSGSSLLDPSKVQVTLTAASGQVFTPAAIGRPTPSEVWVIVPFNMPVGAATATLAARGGATIGTASFTVASVAPGLFTNNVTGHTWISAAPTSPASSFGYYGQTSSGPALAQNYPIVDSRVNSLTNPAVPGQYVTLWGTGIAVGQLSPPTAPPVGWVIDLAGTTVLPVSVGSSGQPGLDQVNFKIPANAPMGCYVPIRLKQAGGDAVSNTVTIAINSTPGACAHPLGLSYGDLMTLDNGGSIRLGQVNINANPVVDSAAAAGTVGFTYKPSEIVNASFGTVDSNTIFPVAGEQVPYDAFFSCQILPRAAGASGGIAGNAGDPLTLSGPAGKSLQISPKTSQSPYILQLPDAMLPFFSAGSWSISAPGNSTTGAFQRSFTLPPPVSGLNRDELASLHHGDDVTVRWNNQGYGISDIATVTATDTGTGTSTSCKTYAFMGIFTLPKTALGFQGGQVTVAVTPAPFSRQQFTVPVIGTLLGTAAPASGVAQTVVNYAFSDMAPVVFQ